MKTSLMITRCAAIFLLAIFQTLSWAQGIEVKVTKETGDWYKQPWVWVAAGAVFILILVALLRNNGKKSS